MRKLVLFALLLPFAVSAQVMVYEDESVTIRLESGPCLKPVADLVRPDVLMIAKAGTALFRGKTIKLCWAVLAPNTVHILDEEGEGGPMPMKEFRPVGAAKKNPKNSV